MLEGLREAGIPASGGLVLSSKTVAYRLVAYIAFNGLDGLISSHWFFLDGGRRFFFPLGLQR